MLHSILQQKLCVRICPENFPSQGLLLAALVWEGPPPHMDMDRQCLKHKHDYLAYMNISCYMLTWSHEPITLTINMCHV